MFSKLINQIKNFSILKILRAIFGIQFKSNSYNPLDEWIWPAYDLDKEDLENLD